MAVLAIPVDHKTNGLTDRYKIWHGDAYWSSEKMALKISNIQKYKMEDGRHLEKSKNDHISAKV